MDGAPAAKNYDLRDINRHLYDALVQSVMKIVEKLDLSVQKVNALDEVLLHLNYELSDEFLKISTNYGFCMGCKMIDSNVPLSLFVMFTSSMLLTAYLNCGEKFF